MAEFRETFAGIGQGAWDVAGGAKTDFQNAYWNQFMGGARPSAPTPLTGDMEITTGPQEPQPQTYGAAFREYADNEQAGRRAAHEADPDRERAREQWLPDPRAEMSSQTAPGSASSAQPEAGGDRQINQVQAPEIKAPAADASTTSSVGPPESWERFYQSAHATSEVDSGATSGIGAPESWQSFNESAHAEPGGQGFYGVGPPAQDTQTQDTAQPTQDSYGPEP